MTIQYASDLHLEFFENKSFLSGNLIEPAGDILILAGDIVPFASMDAHKDFFRYASYNFEKTFWVPGNHEYYFSDVNKRSGTFKEQILSNVFLVNNITEDVNGVKLIFSTLWSNIASQYQWQVEHGMSDFRVIKNGNYRLSVDKFNALHDECFSFVSEELKKEQKGKTVVVTHHIPTFKNYPEKYRSSILNTAFAVELYDFIERTSPDYWIYGHNHFNQDDFSIGKTVLTTNQLGYVVNSEQEGYSNEKVISV